MEKASDDYSYKPWGRSYCTGFYRGTNGDIVQRSAPKVLHPPRKGSSVGLSHTSQKSVIALHICLCFTYKFTWPYDSTERANAYIHSYMKGVPVDQ